MPLPMSDRESGTSTHFVYPHANGPLNVTAIAVLSARAMRWVPANRNSYGVGIDVISRDGGVRASRGVGFPVRKVRVRQLVPRRLTMLTVEVARNPDSKFALLGQGRPACESGTAKLVAVPDWPQCNARNLPRSTNARPIRARAIDLPTDPLRGSRFGGPGGPEEATLIESDDRQARCRRYPRRRRATTRLDT